MSPSGQRANHGSIKPLVLWLGTWTAEIGRTALVSADRFPRGFSFDSISEDRAEGGLGPTSAGTSWNSAKVEPTPANNRVPLPLAALAPVTHGLRAYRLSGAIQQKGATRQPLGYFKYSGLRSLMNEASIQQISSSRKNRYSPSGDRARNPPADLRGVSILSVQLPSGRL